MECFTRSLALIAIIQPPSFFPRTEAFSLYATPESGLPWLAIHFSRLITMVTNTGINVPRNSSIGCFSYGFLPSASQPVVWLSLLSDWLDLIQYHSREIRYERPPKHLDSIWMDDGAVVLSVSLPVAFGFALAVQPLIP